MVSSSLRLVRRKNAVVIEFFIIACLITMISRKIIAVFIMLVVSVSSWSQTDSVSATANNSADSTLCDLIVMDTVDVESCVNRFFNDYAPSFKTGLPIALSKLVVDDQSQTLDIFAKEGFASQVFTQDQVDAIYADMLSYLPEPYNTYDVKIYGFGLEISKLVPNYYARTKDRARLWGPIGYEGNEWVRNMSRPINITRGLQGAHLTIWPSHGNYYEHAKKQWKWQRPRLYCTTEDMFTRSIVVPFLLPMLENSGAVAYSPRERDWHSAEMIVDNDTVRYEPDSLGVMPKPVAGLCGTYEERNGVEPFITFEGPGFAKVRDIYEWGQNPHVDGTARYVVATSDSAALSECRWIPAIAEDGDYAVYATYPATDQNIDDAMYKVRHRGIETVVRVNQRMGGGTWVYLGTFNFAAGNNADNCVSLTNYSQNPGVVMADAVRIGGGMGNVQREGRVSGLPRFLEGSLYYAMWAGMPVEVYDTKNRRNDYSDDINTRSNTLNYLAGGSPYMPETEGLGVPMELSMAVHSDAGARADDNSIVGTLAIYTHLGDRSTYDLLSGIDRLASSDLAQLVQIDICRDLSALIGRPWSRREIFNRNYSECRKPEVPSMILETLSHQNFQDMLLGHDPNFKFTMARAIYKALVRYVATQHERDYVIQPLPVSNFAAEALRGEVKLSWQPQHDELEPTAEPTSYIVYTSREGEDFDNGRLVEGGATSVTLPVEPDVLYRFRVAACNDGGESFPSETLAALCSANETSRVMVVNGFTRLSAPAVVANSDSVGFNLDSDIGVAYINTAEYCGRQNGFLRSKIRVETAGGLGYSGSELEGKVIAGNSFDYPAVHAQAIRDAKSGVSISSASMGALVQRSVGVADYQLLDIIFGLQKDSGRSSVVKYKTFSPELQQLLGEYLGGTGKVLVSGAYVGSDMSSSAEQKFTSQTLGYICKQNAPVSAVTCGNAEMSVVSTWNPQRYAVQSADVIEAVGNAQTLATYADGQCAAVSTGRSVVMGFPFEAVVSAENRKAFMQKIMLDLFK